MLVSIEQEGSPEEDYLIFRAMPEGEVSDDGKGKVLHLLQDHLADLLGFSTILEPPQDQSAQPGQHAGQFEVCDKPVQSIEAFSRVFDQEQGACHIGKIGCSQQMSEAGEVSSDHDARGDSRPQNLGILKLPGKRILAAKSLEYVFSALGGISHVQGVRAMKSRPFHLPAKSEMEEGDVAVPHENFWMFSKEGKR